jgi:UDP-3-O-[3-hydroxymyristoyl] glucosamine N-acyltransferase
VEFQEIIARLGDLAASNSSIANPECNPQIVGVAAIQLAQKNQMSYVEGAKFASMVAQTSASALILPHNDVLQQEATARGIAWIATPQPRLLFARAIAFFYQPARPDPGIHPTAIIDPTVKLGKDVYIGAYAVIEKNATIGDRVAIHPHVTIYPDVMIGSETILYSNCNIHERSQIGSNCVIHSGAIVGAEGFGFVPTATGWEKMEQSGYTVLENGVEIGCNSCVDRPAVGETRIKQNTKLDNLVQIGHGCTVGSNCAIAAQVGLAGGVTIEDGVLLGGQVGVANQITIGKGTIVTAQSGVTHDLKSGLMVTGTPAYPSQDFRKSYAIFKRLPEIYAEFKKLKQFFSVQNREQNRDNDE